MSILALTHSWPGARYHHGVLAATDLHFYQFHLSCPSWQQTSMRKLDTYLREIHPLCRWFRILNNRLTKSIYVASCWYITHMVVGMILKPHFVVNQFTLKGQQIDRKVCCCVSLGFENVKPSFCILLSDIKAYCEFQLYCCRYKINLYP